MIKPKSLTSLSIFFPCYNEEANVGSMIEQALKVCDERLSDYEVLVVDDGSTDDSANIVRQWNAKNPRVTLVQHPRNMGYGAALRTGFQNAKKDLVFLTDGDNQFNLADIEKLFSKIDSCDAVVGFRISRQDKWHRRLNGRLWTLLNKVLFSLPVRDVDCAFKLFRRRILEGLELKSDYLLIHSEILARLTRKGRSIQEVGVPHYPRPAGKATATKPEFIWKTFRELLQLYKEIKNSA